MTTTIETIRELGFEVGLAREHTADSGVPDVYVVRGPGLATYVAVDPKSGAGMTIDDQEALARDVLVAKGYVITRDDPSIDVFTINGGKKTILDVAPGDLPEHADQLPDLSAAA
jgi:hypothetical protein